MNARQWTGIFFMAAATQLTIGTTRATTFTWQPASGTNTWSDTANWSPTGVPGGDGTTDIASIPATATGTINYTTSGPDFDQVDIDTAGTTSLNINIDAPLSLGGTAGSSLGAGSANLITTVNSGGSITVDDHSLSLYGGQFVVESGGLVDMNAGSPNTQFLIAGGANAVVRGTVDIDSNGQSSGNNGILLEGGTLTLDGGTVTVDGIGTKQTGNNLTLTANGGTLNTRIYGRGINLTATHNLNNTTATIDMAGGTVNNGGQLILAGPNAYGAALEGTVTATLSGGTFNQGGFTAIGTGQVGVLNLDGTAFTTANDVYIGGGMDYSTATPTAAVNGTLNISSGSMVVSNTSTNYETVMENKYGSNLVLNSETGGTTALRTGQAVVFTSLPSSVTTLSTGVEYYLTPFKYNTNYLQIAATPGGSVINESLSSGGNAAWTTQYATLGIGNTGTFSDGSLAVPGTLNLSGGSLTVDRLEANMGAGVSTINYTGGNLLVNVSSDIDTGSQLQVGNGTLAATLTLNGTTNDFADGLQVSNNAVLKGGGTITSGTVDIAAGGIVAPGNSIGTLTVEDNFSLSGTYELEVQEVGGVVTGDYLDVNGTLTINAGAVLDIAKLSGSFDYTQPLVIAEYASLTPGSEFSSFTGTVGLYDIDYTYDLGGGLFGIAVYIPEPASLVLLALAGLAMLRRRRCA